MKYEIEVYSRPGTRDINEDYADYIREGDEFLFVVADGLGGHEKGEVASEHVVTHMKAHFDFSALLDKELGRSIREAQKSLLELQNKQKAVNAMKTTVVALAIKKDMAFFAHVGDSRGYAFDKKRSYIRTVDHSVPQMLALSGEIKEKEIRYHSERSSLLRVLGSPWEKDVFEVSDKIDVREMKGFLLCSDGFWELIDEKNMMKCLKKSKTAKEWLERMVEIVEKNGKNMEMDNFTAITVLVMEE